jgi:hypothetical protein
MDDLSRDDILAIEDLPTERVEIPEWKGAVYMRTLSGKQRDEFTQLATDRRAAKRFDIRGLKVRLVAMALCDKDGKLLFGGNGDDAKLNAKAGAAIDRLFQIAQRLSGLSDDELEEMTEGFEKGPNANSGSV